MNGRGARSYVAIAGVLVACGSAPSPEPTPTRAPITAGLDTEDIEPVAIELIADVGRVGAGEQLVVATVFRMDPEWHIYWVNPGESGLATEVELSAPDGFEVGEVRYPGPMRFESPGPVVSYGYTGVAALSAVVQVPDDAGEGPYELSVSASWLACKDACIRGRGEATLTVEGGAREPAPSEVIADHEAALPRPFDELGATAVWASATELQIAIPGAGEAEVFPTVDTESVLQGVAAIPGADGVSLRFSFDSAPDVVRGVIAVPRDGATRFYQLDHSPAPEGAL